MRSPGSLGAAFENASRRALSYERHIKDLEAKLTLDLSNSRAIENLLNDIDGVTGAAVIGVPDDQWGEVPWAVLTVAPQASVTTDSVREWLDGRIARYKMPKNVVVVDEMPRTASGKVRKADLRARFAGGGA